MTTGRITTFVQRARLAVVAGVLSVGCCRQPDLVEPAAGGWGAVVAVKPAPSVGLAPATSWKDGSLAARNDAAEACPHHKEEFEKALGLKDAEACPVVRRKDAPVGPGDGDAEIPIPVAPHCYAAGNVIVVVQYEEPKTTCTRIVGLAVLPKK